MIVALFSAVCFFVCLFVCLYVRLLCVTLQCMCVRIVFTCSILYHNVVEARATLSSRFMDLGDGLHQFCN